MPQCARERLQAGDPPDPRRNLVLGGAFEVEPDETFQPKLVSHVDVTTKPPFTLTYFIRPEARWSDGVPVTASDFVFTYQARLKYPLPEDDDPYRTRIRSVRALDAKTVRVTLGMRFAFWHQLFSEILPLHALRGENLARIWVDRIDDPRTGRPIGSGPFLVQIVGAGQANHVDASNSASDRVASLLPRSHRRSLLSAGRPLQSAAQGEVDIFEPNPNAVRQWQSSEPLVSGIDGMPGITVGSRSGLAHRWEHFDIRSGPGGHSALKNPARPACARLRHRPRRNRPSQADLRERGGRRSCDLSTASSFAAASASYQPNWKRLSLPTDGRARRLLEQAGCRRGTDGIYFCAGSTSFHSASCRGVPETAGCGRSSSSRPSSGSGRCRGCASLLVSARPGARERGLRRHALRVVRRWRRGWRDQFSLRLWG